jgi:hypothetical protein
MLLMATRSLEYCPTQMMSDTDRDSLKSLILVRPICGLATTYIEPERQLA